jgi:tetratricopeptide (TPR) repeat protein
MDQAVDKPRIAFQVEALLPWKDRIDAHSLVDLLTTIQFEVDQAIGHISSFSRPLQIDLAMFADGERLVCLHDRDRLSADRAQSLAETLQQLPLPVVRDVVAFALVATPPGRENVGILPPFDRPRPAGLEAAIRQLEADRGARLVSVSPQSGFGVLLNYARNLLRKLKRPFIGQSSKNSATNSNPLMGRLSAQSLEHFGQLSDQALDEQIARNPADAACYMHRAGRRLQRGAHSEAIEDLSHVIRLAPDAAQAFLQRSQCFAQQAQLERALQDANAAVKLCPNHPATYENRASVYLRLDAWHAAEADYSLCIDLNSLHSFYYYWRSKARWHISGRAADAMADLDEALRLNPYNMDALTTRVTIAEPPEAKDRRLSDDERTVYLDRALRYGPPNPHLIMRRAYAHVSADDPEKALAMCAQALDIDGKFLAAIAVRGLAHYELGDYDQAFLDLTQAIDGDAAWPEIYCRRAELYNTRHEYESAARDADQAIALSEHYAVGWFWRGAARGNMEEHEAAKADFTRARDLAPSWYVPHFNLGLSNLAQKNYQSACEDFSRTIELEPAFPLAWIRRGMCRMELKQEAEAFEDLNRALELAPSLPEAFVARAEAWSRKGDYGRAAEDLTSALKLEPENVGLLYQRAQIWTELHEYKRACDDFNELIRLCPGLGPAYTGRGYIWTQIGNQDQAEQDYQEAILCDPEAAGQIKIHQALAEAAYHHRHERYDQAADKATAALEIDPECRPALRFRAAARWYDEEFVDSIEDYTRLLDLDGEEFTLLSSRGQVYVEMKEFESGLADLDRAIELGIETENKVYLAYARSGRALALAGMDRFDEARTDFEASIADCPENAWVHYNHGRVYDKLGENRKAAVCFQLSLALEDPRLTPRKRERAKAYCEKHLASRPPESRTTDQPHTSVSQGQA